ncbi:phage tail protein [Citrobacter freundii]|nr:phage tail protein [Citrobacter freundii]
MSETVNKVAVLSSAVKHALLADVQYYDFHASSAFNRKMKGIITPGIYGGFKPALAGGLNLKITSLQGPGGHGVASVDVNNHQITVQQIEDVTLAIPVNGVTRVMLEANYQYGIKTSQVDDSSDIHAARIFTANISVPLADNHLEICRVTVPADATELTLDMIDSSHRQNKALGITLSSEIDSDADHIGASSHAVKKAVKAARDETEKQIEELVDNAPASLDTLKKIADAINNDPDFFNTLNAVLALKAPLHDPALTGIATVPTPPLSVSNKQIANTEFVQAAVAALVGSSPEALDTLAELAEALGNDPNFATTMLNKLAGKQPLDSTLTNLSGKDVAGLLQYLGLVETINRAAGALQKDQNGADVPQPDWFVRNIGAARAFSGAVNIGGNGNWTTAEFIVWLENQGAFNHPYWMCKGSWSYGNNRYITDTGCGIIQLAGAVVEVLGVRGAMTIRVTTATASTGGVTSAQFTYTNHGDDYWPGWRRDFNTANKPTSEDVGALPITGGYLRGEFCFLFQGERNQAGCLIKHVDVNKVLACGYGYYQDRFDIHFYDEKGGWVSNPFTVSRNGNVTVTGNLSAAAVLDAGQRVYSPNNPQPISFAGYATQSWVLQNFVQNIRQSGVAYIDAEKNSGQRLVPAGGVLIGSQVNGEWDNNEGFYYTWIQQNINGNWLTIGRV